MRHEPPGSPPGPWLAAGPDNDHASSPKGNSNPLTGAVDQIGAGDAGVVEVSILVAAVAAQRGQAAIVGAAADRRIVELAIALARLVVGRVAVLAARMADDLHRLAEEGARAGRAIGDAGEGLGRGQTGSGGTNGSPGPNGTSGVTSRSAGPGGSGPAGSGGVGAPLAPGGTTGSAAAATGSSGGNRFDNAMRAVQVGQAAQGAGDAASVVATGAEPEGQA